MMAYKRFALMIMTSTIVMFGLMYLNTYSIDHATYSQTRTWMAILMGAVMAIIMMAFMWSMYENKRMNLVIIGCAAVIFAGSLWLVRSQGSQTPVVRTRQFPRSWVMLIRRRPWYI